MGKIQILSVKPIYNWVPLELNIERLDQFAYMINDNPAEDDGHILLVTQRARQELFDFIQWKNMKTPVNRKEQGGLMAGRRYSVPGYRGKVSVITHIFPMYSAPGTSGFLYASAESWAEVYARMDILAAQTGDPLEPIASFHTHPNDLPVFMSHTDCESKNKVFSGEFNYALVLNPHTGRWKAFRDRDARDSLCIMLNTDDLGLLCGKGEETVRIQRRNGREMRLRNISKARRMMKRAGLAE